MLMVCSRLGFDEKVFEVFGKDGDADYLLIGSLDCDGAGIERVFGVVKIALDLRKSYSLDIVNLYACGHGLLRLGACAPWFIKLLFSVAQ